MSEWPCAGDEARPQPDPATVATAGVEDDEEEGSAEVLLARERRRLLPSAMVMCARRRREGGDDPGSRWSPREPMAVEDAGVQEQAVEDADGRRGSPCGEAHDTRCANIAMQQFTFP